MIRTNRLFSRIVLVGALAAALVAGGCGRKGPLDAPPGGAVEQTAYLNILAHAGFTVRTCRHNTQYAFKKDSTTQAALKFQVRSISVLAHRA